ncbi:MAG: hypothetical protein ABWZ66_04020, partial [Pyrinomonadaceae bacterium]
MAIVFTTIFLSPYLQIQLPRTKVHLTISEALIFIALMMYGVEVGVCLAILEVVLTCLSFRRKNITIKPETIALNIASMVIATFVNGLVTIAVFGSLTEAVNNSNFITIVLMLSLMTVVQFTINSAFVAFFMSNKTGKSIWQVWNDTCLNTLVIYIFNAVVAGVFVKAFMRIDAFMVLVSAII